MKREIALVLAAIVLGATAAAATGLANDLLISGALPNVTSLAEQPPTAEARAFQKTPTVADLDLRGLIALFGLSAVLSLAVFFVALRRL